MSNKEKEWKATAKAQIDINSESDISNLNDDDSFLPIEEEEKEPLSEEEKKEVRKKLFILLIIIIAVLIGLIIILIFNPFASKEQKQENEVVEKDEMPTENPEKVITELEDGDISLEHYEIQMLEKEINNLKYDVYENDTIALYRNENTNINSLSDKNKLFLLSKTNNLNSLILSKITTEDICNTDIIIEKNSIDEILKNRFNTSITNYEPFTYNIYNGEKYNKTIKFTYQNNSYIGKCYVLDENLSSLSQQSLISATKDNKNLYIDVKVVFINSTGVYKEPQFTTLITDQNQTFKQYIKNGNTYRYTYDISNNTYSLINVSLLK